MMALSSRRLFRLALKSRRRLVVLVAAFMVVAVYGAVPAFAVHDIKFQLDGDVSASTVTHIPSGSTQSLDWDSFFNASGDTISGSLTGGFTNADFQRDFQTNTNGSFNTADHSTFATGSKDTLNISPGWQCNFDHNVNSKIDIMNAYALAYTDPTTHHELLYFGMEKNKDNGNNDVGFWFLQSGATCVSPSGNTPWTGTHVDGDILVVSEFTSGGGVSNITAYRWNGDGATGSLGTTAVANGGDCKLNTGGDSICATTNSGPNAITGTITTPWLTANSDDGVGHKLRATEFFEGGIDLTDTDLGGKCFNTFVGDTRSSQSLTATLFDFARGELGECTAAVTTTPSISTTKLSDTGAITDLADVYGTTAAGTAGPKPTGTVSFYLCGPGVTSCTTGGTAVTGNPKTLGNCSPDAAGHACATSGDVRSLVTTGGIGKYCFRAVYDPGTDPNYGASKGALDGSSGECFTVTDTSSIVTNQRWLPNDSATVTTGGSAVSGTVTFKLYEDADCGVTAPTAVKATFTDSTPSDGFTTNNTSVYTSSQTISWKATFASDNGVTGSTSSCETSTVTIDNNH